MCRIATSAWIGAITLALFFPGRCPAQTAANMLEAVDLAQQTGRPIFAVAGFPDDAYSQSLRHTLATDGSLRPVLARCVVLVLDVGTDDYRKWSAKYRYKGNYVPAIYFVRADGEQLYGETAIQEVTVHQVLAGLLPKAGKIPTAAELQNYHKLLEEARRAETSGDLAMACDKLSRVVGSGAYAKVALEIEEMAARLSTLAESTFNGAAAQLVSASESLEGAVKIVETLRVFGKLPAVRKTVSPKASNLRRAAEHKQVFAQADLIDQARVYAAKGQTKQSGDAYRQILNRYPDTPAARVAQRELDML